MSYQIPNLYSKLKPEMSTIVSDVAASSITVNNRPVDLSGHIKDSREVWQRILECVDEDVPDRFVETDKIE